MARKNKRNSGDEEGVSGNLWLSTFSDLMNLLLCFFVLLFAMSTIDSEKFEEIAASFRQSFSIFDGGSASITEGSLISSGVSQLSELNDYFSQMGANPENDSEIAESLEAYEEQQYQQQLEASEEIAEDVENQLAYLGMSDRVDIEIDAQYVSLTLNGALLYDSGKAEIKESAIAFVDKIGDVLKSYDDNYIWIIGHTDTVPMIDNGKYSDNMELSSGRAYSVYKYLRDVKGMDVTTMACMGRGEEEPVASNETAEGRALNRRVEIKIFNEYATIP